MNCICGTKASLVNTEDADHGLLVLRSYCCDVCGATFATHEVRSVSVVHLCECGNEARYIVEGDAAPRYCGICDITENEGRGAKR